MPEPTSAELAREAEQEAAVFAQAVNVEKLLNMLRALDPAKDNLADNEEIQVGMHHLSPVSFLCTWISDYAITRNYIDLAWRSAPRS
jgi:hypothetical protein